MIFARLFLVHIALPNFTVFESFFFYARLKLPRKTTNRECFVMAQEVINCLGLAHIRHSIIGDASRRGISGGQKKRESQRSDGNGG